MLLVDTRTFHKDGDLYQILEEVDILQILQEVVILQILEEVDFYQILEELWTSWQLMFRSFNLKINLSWYVYGERKL